LTKKEVSFNIGYMKKLIVSVSIVAMTAFAFVGCSTTSSSNNATELAAITLAASTGTELAIQSKPANAVYFVGAEQALQTLATGTNAVTISTIEVGLQSAGVTNIVIADSIANAIQLGDSLIAANTSTNTPAQLVAVQQVAGAVANGIQQGLTLSGLATLKKP